LKERPEGLTTGLGKVSIMDVGYPVAAGNMPKCKLLGGLFSFFLQVFLVCVVVSTLYFKWTFEEPRRPRKIWIFDSLKQAVAAGTGHLMNIMIAVFFATSQGNECAWYCINSTLDTMFGVPLSYIILRVSERTILSDYPRSGAYYSELTHRVHFRIWLGQTVSWTLTVTATKAIIAIPMFLFNVELTEFGNDLFKPLEPYPRFLLVFVMVFWPAVCNSFQFYVIDNFLKRNVALEDGENISLL